MMKLASVLLMALSVVAFGETPEEAAARLPALFEQGDDAAIDALGAAASPDPWRIAEELRGVGKLDVAAKFAVRAKGPAAKGLVEFLKAAGPLDTSRREAAGKARALALAKKPVEALAAAESIDTAVVDIISVGVCNTRAMALMRMRKRDEAVDAARAGLLIAERLAWPLGEAGTSYFVANLEARRRRPAAAIAPAERARDIYVEVGVKREEARALTLLGSEHQHLGHLRLARESINRSASIYEESGDVRGQAAAANNSGSVSHSLGDLAAALTSYEDAESLYRKAGDGAGIGRVLSNQGAVLTAAGDYRRAAQLLARSVEELDAGGEGDGGTLALALTNLASVHQLLGAWEKARPLLDRAKGLIQGRRHPVATVVSGLESRALLHAGDTRAAFAVLERALVVVQRAKDVAGIVRVRLYLARVAEQDGSPERALSILAAAIADGERAGLRSVLSRCHGDRARVLTALGKPEEALPDLQIASDLALEVTVGLAPSEAIVARRERARFHAIGIRVAAALGRHEEFLRFAERSRANSLLDSMGGRSGLVEVPPQLVREVEVSRKQEIDARAALKRAVASGALKDIRVARDDHKRAIERVELASARVARRGTVSEYLAKPQCVSLGRLQQTLSAVDAAVVFASGTEDIFALVVTSETHRLVRVGSKAELREVIAANATLRPGVDPSAALARLQEAVLAPLEIDSKTRRLVVSPVDATHWVPFDACWPDRSVVRTPSMTMYAAPPDRRADPADRVLALGDPVYDKLPPRPGTGQTVRLARLQASGLEAKAVGDECLVREQATESALRGRLAASPWRAVHLACHGLVDVDAPSLSALALTPHGADDGFLTASEIATLDVRTRVVVLSACESARGTSVPGEGLVGLSRSFFLAGAPRIVASLWKVDDEAARVFMQHFYKHWREDGMRLEEALRAARADLRASGRWSHPAHWAAWSLWGSSG